jgi:surfactin synthase thioesterase subunit
MRVFAIPYAGGNSYCYRTLSIAIDKAMQWETLELPGRGKRLGESLLGTIDEMALDVVRQIKLASPTAFALFGHSMGGLVAHRVAEIMLRDEAQGIELTHLILSGCRPPEFLDRRESRGRLSRAELIVEIDKLGGLPALIRNDPEMMAFFEPILRADFGAVDQYRGGNTPPLKTPVLVLSGRDDQEVTAAHIDGWRGHFEQPVQFSEFFGDHFYFLEHGEALAQRIYEFLGFDRSCNKGVA